MNQFIFNNNAVTTLGSNMNSTTTTLTVATGTGSEFPSPSSTQWVPLTIIPAGSVTGVPNEIVYATARSGDTFTVIRGREGTTAQAWSSGDTVANMATAAFYNNLATSSQVQTQPGNFGVDGGAANSGSITLSPVPANQAALTGVPVYVQKMSNPNTGAYTLNINGLGSHNVVLGGNPLESGQLPGSAIFQVMWDGTNYELLSDPATIDNVNLALMPMNTVKANLTGTPANPQDVTLSDFFTALGFGTYSLTSPGHYSLPGGFLINWGLAGPFYSESAQVVSFDAPFPTACLCALTTIQIGHSSNLYDMGAQIVGSPGTNNMTVYLQSYYGGSWTWPVYAFWIAIGH